MDNSLQERAAIVALVRKGDRYWHQYAQLAELNGSALAVLSGQFYEPGSDQALQLFESSPDDSDIGLEPIVDEIRAWESDGTRLITVLDEKYPTNLRLVHNRPPFLFVKGSIDSVADSRSIAIVGSRAASEDGLNAARDIATRAVEQAFTVVSGLAKGIDTAAHQAAISAGGRTIAVIGTGIKREYPAENRELQREIARRFAVVSQFWPDAPPTKSSFPMRNAVMSGFTMATVVVEAGEKSGARTQARLALEHGRHVFLLRSVLKNQWAREYENRPGVTVVDRPDDVFSKLATVRSAEPVFA